MRQHTLPLLAVAELLQPSHHITTFSHRRVVWSPSTAAGSRACLRTKACVYYVGARLRPMSPCKPSCVGRGLTDAVLSSHTNSPEGMRERVPLHANHLPRRCRCLDGLCLRRPDAGCSLATLLFEVYAHPPLAQPVSHVALRPRLRSCCLHRPSTHVQ